MKKINIKIFMILVLIVGLNQSCSDDFVDVKPTSDNSEDFFNSEQDYQNALIGAYDLLQSTYLNVMLGEIASDNTLAGGESATDVLGIQEVDDMIHTPLNAQLRDIWSWMYAGVNRANYILELVMCHWQLIKEFNLENNLQLIENQRQTYMLKLNWI
jgi:starch-binding outer membrane protein, SusD/RagB family